MASKLRKCGICNGSGKQPADKDAEDDPPPCIACDGTGKICHDPEKNAQEARTLIACMSGMQTCWHVCVKLHGKNDALGLIFLGILEDMPTDQLASECKRRWPRQYASGLRLTKHERRSVQTI